MGMDCVEYTLGNTVRCIVSPPDYGHLWSGVETTSDPESYIHKTGQAGRDGNAANVTMYFSNKDISTDHVEDKMKEYCTN